MSASKPVIVLVRPQLGQNIGKAARAMLNFGLTEMRLVAPRDGWPNPDAGPSASGADVVLEEAQVFETVQQAIADCSNVYASTVRRRDLVMPVITPEQMADGISGSPGRTAILFGPERSGLETEDVALANAIVTVPINPEFGSLNLAQAVILLAYEWSKRSELAVSDIQRIGGARTARRSGRPDRPARRGAGRQGLFPPALADPGDQEHDPHHLHQDRLVLARGEGDPGNRSRPRQSGAKPAENLTLDLPSPRCAARN